MAKMKNTNEIVNKIEDNNSQSKKDQANYSIGISNLLNKIAPSNVFQTIVTNYYPYVQSHILIEELTNLVVDYITKNCNIYASTSIKNKKTRDNINDFLKEFKEINNWDSFLESLARQRSQNGNAFVILDQVKDYKKNKEYTNITLANLQYPAKITKFLNNKITGEAMLNYDNNGIGMIQTWDKDNIKTYKVDEKSKKGGVSLISNKYHGLGIIPIFEFKNRNFLFTQGGYGWDYYPDYMPGITLLPEYTVLKVSKFKETVLNRSKLLGRISTSYIDKIIKDKNSEMLLIFQDSYIESALDATGETKTQLTFVQGNQESLLHIDSSIQNVRDEFMQACIKKGIQDNTGDTYSNKQKENSSKNDFECFMQRNTKRLSNSLEELFHAILLINNLIKEEERIQDVLTITFESEADIITETEELNIQMTKAQLGLTSIAQLYANENGVPIDEAERTIKENMTKNAPILDKLAQANIKDSNSVENQSRGTKKDLSGEKKGYN